jgi:HlyD family secretion protein
MKEPNLEQQKPVSPLFHATGGDGANSSGGGEGMDRKIARKKWPPRKIALVVAVALFVALVAYGFATTTGGRKLNVEREKITIATVERGPFQEFIPVTGNVLPRNTVYLDAVDGGRIEEVYVQEGAMVEEGQPILRLSNSDLQLRLLNAEAQRLEMRDRLQNTRFQLEQNTLSLRQQLTEMDYQIQRLERQYERNQALFEKQLVSEQEFQQTQDEYNYWNRRRELTLQAFQQDSLRYAFQIGQLEQAMGRMEENFEVVQQSLENLTIRAPVSGQLTALYAEVGEIRSSGFRFGQVDVLDGYKVRAGIDEFYITRVNRGQKATTQPIAGKEYRMTITRVYPEVRDGRFEVDLAFDSETPSEIRRGQTIRLRLELGDLAEALLLPRGGFYQTTGGNWVYVVDGSGDYAVRQNIRLGRQNPQFFEVLEGLEPGDEVVTSSYDTFGDADRLVLQ